MTQEGNKITVLTCYDKGCRAAKKFTQHKDGNIKVEAYKAGKYFTHQEVSVSSLKDIKSVIEDISSERRQFIIRGKIKENAPNVVRRKTHEPDAAFDSVARPYIMLDIDKLTCPDFFDINRNPEQVIRWVLDTLPEPFKGVNCYYRFSSSQNVFNNAKGKPENKISVHLWFWCDRVVLDEEWKQYFKSVSSHVDSSLFSAVQPHFTATPIFQDMDDPLPKRSGDFKGKMDAVRVPEIPKAKNYKHRTRIKHEPSVTEENKNKAAELLRPYYRKGLRNNMCGAIGATLYRGGWIAENAAEFVYEFATTCVDEEAQSRYNNALRICDTVDQGHRAQGIPFLRDSCNIENLDTILKLLGVGEPDIEKTISELNRKSSDKKIRGTIALLVPLSDSQQELHIDTIKTLTGLPKGVLRKILDDEHKEQNQYDSIDWGNYITEIYLNSYNNGEDFFRSADKRYWLYNGAYWEVAPDDFIRKEIQNLVKKVIAEHELKLTVLSLSNAALTLLEGEAYHHNDPFNLKTSDVPSVINCANGELWFDGDGNPILKPHRSDSYLRYYLDIDYEPTAISPMFDKAVLEIFSKSSDPKDMFRHFMEVAGYICQPWRKIPIIVLLYGQGSNGKSSLMKLLIRVLSNNLVSSGRISDIGKDKFQTANLDGKFLLFEDDIKAGTRLDDGFLKMFSEEKLLTAEHKYQKPYSFFSRAVPVMGSNSFPILNDLSPGFRRRMLAIPFQRHFSKEEIDTDLFDRLWDEEASGILNHFINGFKRLKERGQFKEPIDCLHAKEKWLSRSNTFTAFIQDRCEVDKHHKQYLKDFYGEYVNYCRDTGIYNVQRQQWLRAKLEDLEYEVSIKDGQPIVRGIRALNPELKYKS